MTRSIHREAEADLAAAVRYYKIEARMAVAARFLDEVERVAALLEADPGLGTPTGQHCRVHPLRGFPYAVIYREIEGGIRILVVRHQSRDPGFGESRS